ncbi:MAG TPA: hypothetical protein ENN67_06345 [Firmicutes bacterium]|nr:hypothetical protein [Bacillota bacterium]
MTKNKTTNDKSSGKSQNEGYGIFDLLWLAITDIPRIMRTLKFAVWVIIILAIFTLFGTILPQEKFASDPETFAAQYVGLFNIDDTDGKTTFGEFLYYGFVRPFELYRVYESGLYLTLLMVLSISSALCAWDRWKITRTLATKTNPKANPDSVRTSQYSSHGTVTSNIETVTEKARSLLASKGFRTFETTDENGTVYFFGRKNFIKHYASVGFHFAFVFILIGGIIGHDQFFGYEGRIALSEGEERPVGPEMNLQRQAEAEGKTRELCSQDR